jgi:hypothetical protein
MTRLVGMVLALLWCASVCAGQEVWFLSPRTFVSPPGEAIEVGVDVGGAARVDNEEDEQPGAGEAQEPSGVRPMPFPSAIAQHVFVRGGGRQWNLDHPLPVEVDGAWIRVPAPAVGVAMIGLQTDPVVETYTAAQLRTFIRERAPAFEAMTIPQRNDLRVRVVRCAKTLVRIDDEQTRGWSSPVPLSKAGQRSEIRLNTDPTVIDLAGENGAAAEIPVRLYADWRSRQGVTFTATNVTTGEQSTLDANDTGNGTVFVNAPGVWQIEFHYLIAMDANAPHGQPDGQPDGQEAVDFELHSATLTFMVSEGGSR